VEERKVITVLFCDLVGFTARSDQADPEDVRALLRPYHARLRREIERLGGTVDKFIGDGVMAVFGVPNVHEDDPERAVRCALRVLDAITELNQATPELGLAVRIGIMTGEAAVILDPRPYETEGVVGDVVNTASRLQNVAPTGTVVVGEPTWWATRTVFHYEELEPVQVKGKAKPLAVWRAVAPRSRLGVDVKQRPATPLVDRHEELGLLRRLYQQTRRERAAQLVTIVGEPGIGKSRLVRELLRFVDEQPELVVWRQGHCLPYGEGITFWALGEIVKAQAGVLESDDGAVVTAKLEAAVAAHVADQDEREWLQLRLAPLLGLAGSATASAEQAEQFTAWRRFLEAIAARGPLTLVVEDLHWADDALLAFLDYLLGAVRGVALLIVTTARPELFERHPGWPREAECTTMIPLAALDDGDTARLIGALLGRSRLPAELEASLLERADGNPLYAEEYVRLLNDRGLLAAPDGSRRTAGTGLPLPPTLQAVIAARLDALPSRRKALLQNAAVVGKVFWSGALTAMTGLDENTLRNRRTDMLGTGRPALRNLSRPSPYSPNGSPAHIVGGLSATDAVRGKCVWTARGGSRGVEDLASGGDTDRPGLAREDAANRFHRERRGDSVDVLASRHSAPFSAAGAHDDVDEEGLRGPPTLVDRSGRWCVRGRHVAGRLDRHVCAHLRDGQVAGDGDDVGHRELDDSPGAHRVGKGPLQGGRVVIAVLQPPVGVADASAVPPPPGDLARGARPGGGVPTAQPVRDVRLVGRRPGAHRRRDQQVAEAAVEGHRGDDHRSCGAGAVREVREGIDVGLDFGRHIHIRNPGAQCRLDHGGGGRGEGPGTVDHSRRTGQCAVERGRIADRRRPGVESGIGRCQRLQLVGVAAGENREEPAIPQLGHHEPPGVSVRAEHRHRVPRSHAFSPCSNDPLRTS
jgi:class 3 adenylate cyclase